MLLSAGETVSSARAAMILVHGRDASARDILLTTQQLERSGFAFLAPEAAGGEWYPQPFTAPLEANEPWLSRSLVTLAELVSEAERFLPAARLLILGFSQGACLALEFAARNPRRYGGIIGWSGALIGADGAQAERNGSLDATPVLLGCSDVDPYIGEPRVRDAAAVMEGMGARVDLQIYPGMGHEVNMDEINRVQQLMADVIRAEKEVA
jgi:alpha-beta hydrolase superfamily lysophospholipase